MTPLKEGCNTRIFAGSWHGHRCNRTIVEGGKCRIHCKTAVAARAAKSEALRAKKREQSPYAAIGRLQKQVQALQVQNMELFIRLRAVRERCAGVHVTDQMTGETFAVGIDEVLERNKTLHHTWSDHDSRGQVANCAICNPGAKA